LPKGQKLQQPRATPWVKDAPLFPLPEGQQQQKFAHGANSVNTFSALSGLSKVRRTEICIAQGEALGGQAEGLAKKTK